MTFARKMLTHAGKMGGRMPTRMDKCKTWSFAQGTSVSTRKVLQFEERKELLTKNDYNLTAPIPTVNAREGERQSYARHNHLAIYKNPLRKTEENARA